MMSWSKVPLQSYIYLNLSSTLSIACIRSSLCIGFNRNFPFEPSLYSFILNGEGVFLFKVVFLLKSSVKLSMIANMASSDHENEGLRSNKNLKQQEFKQGFLRKTLILILI